MDVLPTRLEDWQKVKLGMFGIKKWGVGSLFKVSRKI